MEEMMKAERIHETAETPLPVEWSEARKDLWMVQAIIQGFKLDAVTLALEALPGFGGMTVLECRGFGRDKIHDAATFERGGGRAGGSAEASAPSAAFVDFTPKLLIQTAVAGRAMARAVVETIRHAAHTGRRGDGKIFVWPLSRVVHIQYMTEDAEAL